jgi:glycosyltransferase involved in cell wall biosynthesis
MDNNVTAKTRNMKTRVAIIGTVGLPARYGGFETLAAQLVTHLGHDHALTVYCSGKQYPQSNRPRFVGEARLHYIPLQANGMQSILYDALSILHALFYADVLLVLGVAGAWTFPFIRLFTRKKIVVSIDGIEWKRAKWGQVARWFLAWSEGLAVRYSHIDISDNEAIQDYTAARYGTLSRIVEYGADHVQPGIASAADKAQYPFLRFPYAIKVCRIEPENNVELVLEAFAALSRHKLVLIGNWDHSHYSRALRERFSGYANLYLLDPIYDQARLDVLRSNAHVYIHGHGAGGTNPSLIEAMFLGLPVLAFGVSYNRKTTEDKAHYFRSAAELQQLVETLPLHALMQQAAMMRRIAERRYTWAVVADRYRQLIAAALAPQPKDLLAKGLKASAVEVMQSAQIAHLQQGLLFFEKSSHSRP